MELAVAHAAHTTSYARGALLPRSGSYADVAQSVEYRTRMYARVRVPLSAPEAGQRPDNVRPFVLAHMEMTMTAENCTVGGNRLNVMVPHM